MSKGIVINNSGVNLSGGTNVNIGGGTQLSIINVDESPTFSSVTTTSLVVDNNLSGKLLSVSGVTGELLSVNDDDDDNIFSVEDSVGSKLFLVNKAGYSMFKSKEVSVVSGTTIYTFPTNIASSGFINYSIALSGGSRAGTIQAVWSDVAVEFSEYQSGDLGVSTSGVSFSMDVLSENVRLIATSVVGSCDIKLSVKLL